MIAKMLSCVPCDDSQASLISPVDLCAYAMHVDIPPLSPRHIWVRGAENDKTGLLARMLYEHAAASAYENGKSQLVTNDRSCFE